MATSTMRATLACPVQRVWDVVTSLTDTAWRSDLASVEILSAQEFIEHTRDGFSTRFTITHTDPCKRWEFDLETANMRGHWVGEFTEDGGSTILTFTENVTAKKWVLRPFVGLFLRKQQAQYLHDLQKAPQIEP